MAERTVDLRAEGHLIDTGLMSRFLDLVVENGAAYEIRKFDIGRRVEDYSKLVLRVSGPSQVVDLVVRDLVSHGCVVEGDDPVRLVVSAADRTVPHDVYSSTNHRSEGFWDGDWLPLQDQRMDACLVVDPATRSARCVKLRDVRAGDRIVCGATGVRVYPPFKSREAKDFVFMANDVSSERRVERMVEVIADEMQEIRARKGRTIVVAGPVVVHTGGGEHLARLIRAGFVEALLAGNEGGVEEGG